MILEKDVEKVEIDLLLEGVRRRYGYDFTHYSFASLKRRLILAREQGGFSRFTEMLDRLLHDEQLFDSVLKQISISTTEMFRDPEMFRGIREKIIPTLKTFPFIKIWQAGCATGEEAYSMAILLHEEEFLDRSRIYATDFNKHSLDIAQNGVYCSRNVEAYADNYRAFEGRRNFSDYYNTAYDLVKLKDFLKEQITFSYHNLVTDGVFGEMNLILCRNVLIYFDKKLQDRVLTLFAESLRHGGFLCLGSKETLNFSAVESLFEVVDPKLRIYKKRQVARD